MPERRSVRLKIPSERLLLLQQSMDGVKKKERKTRVNWKPGEKEAMLALREQDPDMPLKEFQETYYPNRSIRNLSMIICKWKKETGKEEKAETGSEDRRHLNTPGLSELKRPRKSGPFYEFSDSEDGDSSSDERIEDINPSGLRTPNKFIKLSHSTEAHSPLNRYEKQRDPRIRSRTDENPQIPKETIAFAYRLQTTPPETTTVAQDSGYSEPSSSSTGMSPIVLDVSQEQAAECHGTEMQVDVVTQDEPQQQTQLQALKQEEAFPEYFLRQESAKDSADMFAKVQSQCRRQEELFTLINQLRAENCILQKAYDVMKQDYDLMKKEYEVLKVENQVEIGQLKEQWQAEKEYLEHKNARFLEKMQDVVKDLQAGHLQG